MKYTSTRNNDIKINSAEAIIKGLSNEGGLFVPSFFPGISLKDIEEISKNGYHDVAYFVLSKYLTDFTENELKSCINKAYTREKFETDSIVPLYELNDKEYYLELWHGPTCAFKDMALQILPHLMTTSSKKTGEDKTITILVATSGDTGKAALEGFKDVSGTKIIVFYPQDGVSDIQKLQMITQEGENVFVSSVLGNFDDAQNGVKEIFTNTAFNNEIEEMNFTLSSANSINFGRLVPQIVYYFYAYCDLYKNNKIKLGEKINFVVPTGNFGNILAAFYAKKMGLPVNKLICASNRNNILTDFIYTGIYDRNRDFYLTYSPSMDILISSNLERFLYEITNKSDKAVTELMQSLKNYGKYEVDDELKNIIKDNFYGGYCDDKLTLDTIKNVYKNHDYLIDTHTAVAKAVYDDYKNKTDDDTVTVIASTASPYKFASSVLCAIKETSENYDNTDETLLLKDLSDLTNTRIPKPLSNLSDKKINFESICEKGNMIKVVRDFLKK